MARKPRPRPVAGVDPDELASFRVGLRRRYSDEQILAELQGCAGRTGRAPTMKEYAADPETRVHPQTVVERFGTWNAAQRAAGLVPRRFATREELLGVLRRLGDELGRAPNARDLDARRGRVPSKSLYWHTFGSLSDALREAGFPIETREERLERAVGRGAELARTLGRLPRFADWVDARRREPDDTEMLTAWQVYGLFEERRGAWTTFQFLVGQRLVADGTDVRPDGTLV